MPATRTMAKDVSQENRESHPVVRHLQRQVANAFVLYANYKHGGAHPHDRAGRAARPAQANARGGERGGSQQRPWHGGCFSKAVQIHEKHEWFLRQVLKKKDGLVT
ncbi:MAG: hypothetical protein ACRD8O_18045 [Bryobacteraceae bacterium]